MSRQKKAGDNAMKCRLNLKKDSAQLSKYISRRCQEFPEYVNAGPGKDDDAIRLITLGFSFEQSGWVALVFDTRPKAAFDGKWQNYIEENAESFPAWSDAFDRLLGGGTMSVTLPNGRRRSFSADSDIDEIGACFGEICRDLLVQAFRKGKFDKLPLSPDCRLAVEEHEGRFAWIEGQEKETEVADDPKIVQEKMKQAAKKLSNDARIAYWIEQLDRFATSRVYGYAADSDLCDFVFRELSQQAKQSTVPLLEWANRWADRPEFKAPSEWKEGEHVCRSHQDVLCKTFRELGKWGITTPEAENLIRKYIATATRVEAVPRVASSNNAAAREGLHGIVPRHAATLLHGRFKGYPEPKVHRSTNQLLNARKFCGEK